VLLGANGVGKTMIAKNLAYQGALAGHSVLFVTAAELLDDLRTEVAQTTFRRKLTSRYGVGQTDCRRNKRGRETRQHGRPEGLGARERACGRFPGLRAESEIGPQPLISETRAPREPAHEKNRAPRRPLEPVSPGEERAPKGPSENRPKLLMRMVGARGFEPPTSWSRTK
jgi:hypothetical protein